MGYFWRQAATLFKGIFMTSKKERIEVHRAEKYGEDALELATVEFPELLEVQHRVTRFMNRLVKFVKDIKIAGNNCFLVLYNQSTQDMAEERAVHAILIDDLHSNWQSMPNNPELKAVEKKMLLSTTGELQKSVGNERTLYKELEAIMIEAAEPEKEHQDIVDAASTLFKKRESIGNKFEEIAWKRAISQARRAIRDTRKIEHSIKALMSGIKQAVKAKKPAYVKSNIIQLEGELGKASGDIASMYKFSYLVKQRALFFFMRLLYIGEQVEKFVQKEVAKSYAPHSAEEKLFEEYKIAMRDLSKDLRIVAQEFRIVVHEIESDIHEAKRLATAA